MTGDQAKFYVGQLVNTLRFEMGTTAKVLAAVTEEGRSYRPDPKSRTAWELATHIATGDVWFITSALNGSFVWDGEANKAVEAQLKTVQDVVDFYKREFGAALERAASAPVDVLTREVDFFGQMKMPAVNYLMLTITHSVHHRGQLAAYLRALGSKVPNIYGASGDAEQ